MTWLGTDRRGMNSRGTAGWATHRDVSGCCDALRCQEPWALAIAVCTAGAIFFGALFGTIGGFIGFQLGQQPTIIVQFR